MIRTQLTTVVVLATIGVALCQFQQYGGQQSNQYAQQRSVSCPEANGTFPVAGQCDAYIECKDGVGTEMLCPDGLLFNDKLGPKHFPCQYPIDVNCETRAKLQPPQATDECPHQFGYFKMGDSVNCGQFMNCVNGRGFTFDCPEGLAFSQETYRCEWPDMVSDCDAESFVGFTCPQETQTDTVTHYTFFRHAQDCQVYYICLEGRPRMYRCTEGKLFDTLTNTCEAAENVTTCADTGFRTLPKNTLLRQEPTPAPVVVQRATQRPYQFNSFAGTTAAPKFNSGLQGRQVQQKSAFQFNQAPVTKAPFLVKIDDEVDPFIQPRTSFGNQGQYQARTTQPQSPLPETRSQIGTSQFNFRSTGRGGTRYTNGGAK